MCWRQQANGFLNAGGRGFGWYCLFVAITAVAAGIYTFRDANGNTASIWLGIDWFAWAVLWFMFSRCSPWTGRSPV